MKTHVACIFLIVLFMGLFAVAQETANNTSSAAAFSGNAVGPLVTYKTVKTAAPYGTANYLPVWTGLNTIANSLVYQSGSKVGIGTTTPSATLDVKGNINAATSFNLGGTPFAFGTYSAGNAFLGFAGNGTTTGSYNTSSGYQALYFNTSGYQNTADGASALYSNTGGFKNTASGVFALRYNTDGVDNTANGYSALLSNTTGSNNTAIGYQALASNTTGAWNTASGEALFSNTTGLYNTGDGGGALDYNTTGNFNTAVGYFSGVTVDRSSMTSGSNTFLGYYAAVATGTLTNVTAIGANAEVTASNALVLGSINGVNGASANTNVGIGTTAPSRIFMIGQGFGHAIADGWDTYSSRRWKTNIQTLHDALSKVEQLRGVSYDLKANGRHEVGVIAEEVGAVVPEVVTWEKNGKDAESVDYGRLTALLIEATKEQQALIREQQEQIRAQQAQNQLQQAEIERLGLQVKAIQAALNTTDRTGSRVRTVKTEATTVRQ